MKPASPDGISEKSAIASGPVFGVCCVGFVSYTGCPPFVVPRTCGVGVAVGPDGGVVGVGVGVHDGFTVGVGVGVHDGLTVGVIVGVGVRVGVGVLVGT